MRRIALPQDGLETIFGAHDANLKFVEGLFGVTLRTQGDELIVNGTAAGEAAAGRIFEQLVDLLREGYSIGNGDVKTAAQLLSKDPETNLRD
jgi:phosphate starvation-inducible PhoH-like protein